MDNWTEQNYSAHRRDRQAAEARTKDLPKVDDPTDNRRATANVVPMRNARMVASHAMASLAEKVIGRVTVNANRKRIVRETESVSPIRVQRVAPHVAKKKATSHATRRSPADRNEKIFLTRSGVRLTSAGPSCLCPLWRYPRS